MLAPAACKQSLPRTQPSADFKVEVETAGNPPSAQRDPEKRRAVIVVRTNEPGLPVFAGGVVVAETNERGVAHASVYLEPGSYFRVVLDTSSDPLLRPRNPTTVIGLGDADQIFLVEQDFALESRVRRARVQKMVEVAPEVEVEEPVRSMPLRIN